MLIVCPHCATTYQIAAESVGDQGRPVRCARCATEWVAQRPRIVPAMAHADALDVVADGPVFPPHAPRGAPAATDYAAAAADVGAGEYAAPADANTASVPQPGDSVSGDPVSGDSMPDDNADTGEADRVLAEITGAIATTDAPSLVPAQTPDDMAAEQTADAMSGAMSETMPGAAVDAATEAPHDIELVAARRGPRPAAKRRKAGSISPVSAAILALLLMNGALLFWRESVVRMLPQTASLYAALGLPVNLRGLTLADVHTTMQMHDGVNVLVVEGHIVAQGKRPVDVPRLRIAVRDDAGSEIYAWTAKPTATVVAPGERLAFRSRLASPPNEAARVEIRFLTRADLARGLR